jgi:hypothetical protein
LHQLGIAMSVYAQDNTDNLPRPYLTGPGEGPATGHDKAGSSLWDVPDATGDNLSNDGRSRAYMYCPGGYTKVLPDDYWWYYNRTPPDADYHVTSYVWLFQRNDPAKPDPNSFTVDPIFNARRGFIRKMGVSWTNLVTLPDSELVSDITISEGTGNADTDKWTGVFTSGNGAVLQGGGYSPNHMNGNRPAGGNILYQDIHAGWRSFRAMKVRYQWTNSRNFWW